MYSRGNDEELLVTGGMDIVLSSTYLNSQDQTILQEHQDPEDYHSATNTLKNDRCEQVFSKRLICRMENTDLPRLARLASSPGISPLRKLSSIRSSSIVGLEM